MAMEFTLAALRKMREDGLVGKGELVRVVKAVRQAQSIEQATGTRYYAEDRRFAANEEVPAGRDIWTV